MPDTNRPLVTVAAAVLGALAAQAASAAEGEDTAITIYSSAAPGAVPPEFYRPIPGSGVPNAMSVPGYAMVRHDRPLKLANGRSTIKFTDVAALIDPTTVTFSSLSEPRTRVIEQNFQFDLVSTDKLLLKYLDKQITVERAVGNQSSTVTGTLLSAVDGLVLRANDGTIHALQGYSAVRFPELPGGLNTKPTLVWDVIAPAAGEQKTRVTYQTGGITWWADYNLIFNEGKDANSGVLDLSAWVSIINQSGATYPESRLKLIAGDVHRAAPPPTPMLRRQTLEMADASANAAGFEEKAFSEFHLYTLGRRTTLPNNSTKQIELFDQAKQIAAKKVLVYYGLQMGPYFYPNPVTDRDLGVPSNKKVDVYLEFKNDKQFGLGVPLPVGTHPRVAGGQGRCEPGVHRRGHDRSHAQGRGSAREARLRVRRRRRAPPARLQGRQQGAVGRGRDRSEAAQPQGPARRRHREGKPVSLDELVDPQQDARVHQGRRAHDPLPGASREGRRDRREIPRSIHLVRVTIRR